MFVEHVNLAVTDCRASADFYESIFDWRTRWEGSALGGRTVHVGDDRSYLALFTAEPASATPSTPSPLNHVGIVVDELDTVAERLRERGVRTFSHSTYEPGSRFYFFDPDGIEIEVVSYAD